MAEVIEGAVYDHRPTGLTCYDHDTGWCCVCGTHELLVTHRQHLARATERALSAAGFGPVQEAKAQAIREAAEEMRAERHSWCLDDSGRYWIKRTLDELADRAK
jgi:hypothetical protein